MQDFDAPLPSRSIPRWLGANVERVIAARRQPERMKRIFDSSLVPMVLVDNERRYVDVNTPARLAFRLSLAELQRLRVDDLTPKQFLPGLEAVYERLIETGCVAGRYDVALPDGSRLDIAYYALADALPGVHLGVFAPAEWPDAELLREAQLDSDTIRALTPREREVLELAADGHNAPMIANELVVSVATVRTHFGNIYEKLGVGDRAAAVAKALRLGLIA
jgi:DNA-binding CsgD family transcriptional regulator